MCVDGEYLDNIWMIDVCNRARLTQKARDE
jgi:hypothetical protein